MTVAPLAGRYRLDVPLGEGSFASVYEARDLQTGDRVAIKVLKDSARARPLLVERFRREGRTLEGVEHPHLMEVIEVGCDDGRDYLVLSYVDGGSLGERLEREGPMALRPAIALALQVLSGLAHLHALGIVHRDVKPPNVLLSEDRAVLGDFGIAARVGSQDSGRITRTGATLGTFGYMAPEQLIDAKSVGPTADLYGLGATLYHAVTGHPPSNLHAAGPMSARWQRVPAPLTAVLRRATCADPTERWSDAREMARALVGLLEPGDLAQGALPESWPTPHAELLDPPPPPVPETRANVAVVPEDLWTPPPASRHHRGQLLLVAGLLVLLGALALATWG